jgi:hypothetical protein
MAHLPTRNQCPAESSIRERETNLWSKKRVVDDHNAARSFQSDYDLLPCVLSPDNLTRCYRQIARSVTLPHQRLFTLASGPCLAFLPFQDTHHNISTQLRETIGLACGTLAQELHKVGGIDQCEAL